MRKTRLIPLSGALGALALTSAALAAAPAPKVGVVFSGTSKHSHYAVSITTKCSAKKCSHANEVVVNVTAGNRARPIAGCPYAGYVLPPAKIVNGKFKAATQFVVIGKGNLAFVVSGSFSSTTRASGTVNAGKACGGADSFTVKGKVPPKTTTVGPTS